jgi:RNA polymerase sigma-70 factor (ECF subfamily)
MAGSIDDADDLLQESLVRAWRGLPAFEGRANLRTWLYRVTSSACIDALKKRTARKRAEDQGPAADPAAPMLPAEPDAWIGPCPASLYTDLDASPEARYTAKQSVGFAFLAALQLLPPMQRAALIGCDVLGWTADECAALLDSSATAIYSALRRARETIAARMPDWQPAAPDDDGTRALIASYVDAWERVDVEALVTMLHRDATMSMPPLPIWLSGAQAIARSLEAMVFATASVGAFRFVELEANGLPALAAYRRDDSGSFMPYALQVLAIGEARVRTLTAFLDTRVFAGFGLAARL